MSRARRTASTRVGVPARAIDVLGRGILARRLVDLLAADCDEVALDVGSVSHIDQVGLRLLDDAWRRLTARGARVEVRAASLCFVLVSGLSGHRPLARAAQATREPSASRP